MSLGQKNHNIYGHLEVPVEARLLFLFTMRNLMNVLAFLEHLA